MLTPRNVLRTLVLYFFSLGAAMSLTINKNGEICENWKPLECRICGGAVHPVKGWRHLGLALTEAVPHQSGNPGALCNKDADAIDAYELANDL